MNFLGSNNTNRPMQKQKRDNAELENSTSIRGTLTSFGKDTANKVGEGFADVGKGVFEQLLNMDTSSETSSSKEQKQPQEQQEQTRAPRKEGGTLFSFREQQEKQQIEATQELIEQIRQEVVAIRNADQTLMGEVKDVENLTINSLPEKSGIYHIRFLEIVLKVLETLRKKINESSTWMEALMSKKAKRGSAFAARSKKKGTQYSMSKELSNARSVQ